MWYLVRHPETEWNRAGRYQGWRDIPLSPAGQVQRRRLIGQLGQLQAIQAVLSSDLNRCLAVAEPLAQQLHRPLCALSALRELDFGAWEGLTFAEIGQRYPQRQAAWLEDPQQTAPPGGETLRQLTERVQQALAPYLHSRIIVVTHGGVIAAIPQHWGGQAFHLPAAGTCLTLDVARQRCISWPRQEQP